MAACDIEDDAGKSFNSLEGCLDHISREKDKEMKQLKENETTKKGIIEVRPEEEREGDKSQVKETTKMAACDIQDDAGKSFNSLEGFLDHISREKDKEMKQLKENETTKKGIIEVRPEEEREGDKSQVKETTKMAACDIQDDAGKSFNSLEGFLDHISREKDKEMNQLKENETTKKGIIEVRPEEEREGDKSQVKETTKMAACDIEDDAGKSFNSLEGCLDHISREKDKEMKQLKENETTKKGIIEVRPEEEREGDKSQVKETTKMAACDIQDDAGKSFNSLEGFLDHISREKDKEMKQLKENETTKKGIIEVRPEEEREGDKSQVKETTKMAACDIQDDAGKSFNSLEGFLDHISREKDKEMKQLKENETTKKGIIEVRPEEEREGDKSQVKETTKMAACDIQDDAGKSFNSLEGFLDHISREKDKEMKQLKENETTRKGIIEVRPEEEREGDKSQVKETTKMAACDIEDDAGKSFNSLEGCLDHISREKDKEMKQLKENETTRKGIIEVRPEEEREGDKSQVKETTKMAACDIEDDAGKSFNSLEGCLDHISREKDKEMKQLKENETTKKGIIEVRPEEEREGGGGGVGGSNKNPGYRYKSQVKETTKMAACDIKMMLAKVLTVLKGFLIIFPERMTRR
nr:myb-like protein X [Coffea arabica]